MFSVHDYLRPLYRRRWLAGTAFASVVVVALLYAFTATPVYRATARLLIDPQDPNVVTFQEVIVERGVFSASNVVQTTQRDMLRSRSLARATIDRLGLLEHPEFGGPREESRWSRTMRALNPIRLVRGALSWLRSVIFPAPDPAEDALASESRAETRAISALLARLEVVAGRQSRVITLRFSAFEPALAADVVNTLARLHVERDMEFRYTSSRNASEWLEQRIAEQRQKLETSERALQSYREQHGAAAIADRQNIIVRELENLHAAATQATLTRVESEARYRDLQAAQDDPEALGRFPEILRNEVIQEQRLILAGLLRNRARLGEELGPRHPNMIAVESAISDAEDRLQNEVLAVVDSLRIEFEVASSRERQLAQELDRQTQNALALDRTGIEYGVMRREAESARQLYESLLQRAAETGVTGELETSNIRVLDEAETPTRPARPRRQLVLLLGMLGGGVFAVGLVFGLEHLDDAIQNPDDMRAHLDAPYLGMVPFADLSPGSDQADASGDRSAEPRPARTAARIRDGLGALTAAAKQARLRRSAEPAAARHPDTPDLLLTAGAPASFAEAIRSVRTNLIFASADEGCRSVLVTSAAPGEGKSCMSANLAISLAQLGRRTLLVDADLRRPQQHSFFGLDLEPGLSNLLVAEAEEAAALRETSVPGLSVLTAGKTPPNPTDLVGSDRFARFLDSCRNRYDWIVLDTTPVLPVADALLIARVVGKVMFIVGTGTTSRRVASDALEKIAHTGAVVLGTVLNKAELERHPYYYSRYYRREYSRHYRPSPAG